MEKGKLIIHPADPSTDFLKALYPVCWEVLREGSRSEIKKKLSHTTHLMLLGHGTENGLIGPSGEYKIAAGDRYYLSRVHKLVGIWCNANIFAGKLGLHGLFSGMVISEVSEAEDLGIKTSKEELDIENLLWSSRLGALLESDLPIQDIPEAFKTYSGDTPLRKFNYDSLEVL